MRTPGSRSLLWAVMLASVAAVLAACAGRLPGNAAAPVQQTAKAPRPLRIVEVPPPPGIEAELVTPRTGEALARARLPLEQILASLPQPKFLDEARDAAAQAASGAEASRREEPPLAAQHAYVAGREAYRAGQNYIANPKLDQALRLAPNAPEIHRLLARTNAIKATYHLERALALDPDDLESAFLLGRQLAEQRRWDECIAVFGYANELRRKLDDRDTAMSLLISYFLGSALERQQYDEAAVVQLLAFLQSQVHFGLGSRMSYQLALARRQSGPIWQMVGDAHHRLNDPAKALSAYERAADEGVNDMRGLISRVAYTLLRLDQPQAAQDALVQYFKQTEADAASMALVLYLVGHGVDGQALARELVPVYREAPNASRLAMLIAELLDPQEGAAFLEQHLASHPGDRVVFESLLQQQVGAATSFTPQVVAMVLEQTAAAIEASPASATEFGRALFEVVNDASVLLTGLEELPPTQRQRPAMRFLKALCLIHAGRAVEAQPELEAILDAQPPLPPARLVLARLLIAEKQYEQAEEVLEPIKDQPDPQIAVLRSRVMAQTDRADEAVRLLDDAIAAEPQRVELIIEKAALQILQNDPVASERTLLDALTTRPLAEPLYEMLFNLYDTGKVPDATDQYARLMTRIQGAIPQSRLARFKLADWYFVNRNHDAAERLLRDLLRENPRDFEAMRTMLDVLVATKRGDQADTLLEEQLAKAPKDPMLLALALEHYRDRVKDAQKVDVFLERLLQVQPRSAERDIGLAQVYMRTGQLDRGTELLLGTLRQADKPEAELLAKALGQLLARYAKGEDTDRLFRQCVESEPQHEAELRFWWAVAYEQIDDRARSEKMMLEVLEKFPDHAATNNSLGYIWAYEGKNLNRAKAMIERALDAEPDNAAYLDSLGWVYYKLGDFEQALRWLKQSSAAEGGQDPVILDHIGDALYRMDRQDEAVTAWRAAQSELRQDADSSDPERRTLPGRLRQKLEAARTGAPAPVADIAVPPAAP